MPLRNILANPQETSRLEEWASYLSTYNIVFELWSFEKGHVVASLLYGFLVKDIISKDEDYGRYISNLEPQLEATISTKQSNFNNKEWTIFHQVP